MAEWEAAALEALAADSDRGGVGFRAVARRHDVSVQGPGVVPTAGRRVLLRARGARRRAGRAAAVVERSSSADRPAAASRRCCAPASSRRSPRARCPGSQHWPACCSVPGPDPLEELAHQLSRLDPDRAPDRAVRDLAADPAVRARVRAHGRGAARDRPVRGAVHADVRARRDRDAFLEVLATLTASRRRPVRVVIALRADFYSACARYPWLADRISDNQVLVGPMRRPELRRAIEGPAQRAGLRLEPGLTEAILDEAGDEPGSLPLVAHALMETWLRRRGTLLTVDGFRAAGGVVGAIAQSAEDAYERLDDAERVDGATSVPPARDARRRHARHAPPALVGRDRRPTRDPRRRRHAGHRPTADRRRPGRRDRARDAHPHLAATCARGSTRTATIFACVSGSRRPPPSGPRRIAIPICCFAARRSRRRSSGARTRTSGSPRRRPCSSTRAATLAMPRKRRAAAERSVVAGACGASRSPRCRCSRSRRWRRASVAFVALRQSQDKEAEAEDRFGRALGNAGRVARADAAEARAAARRRERGARRADHRRSAAGDRERARRAVAASDIVPEPEPIPVGDVLTVLVTPDGSTIVTGARDGTIRLWDTATGEPTAHPAGTRRAASRKPAIDPSGRWLVAVGAGGVWRWDLESSGPRASASTGPTGALWSVAFSRGRHAARDRGRGRCRPALRHATWTATGEPFTADVDFLSVAFTLDGHDCSPAPATAGCSSGTSRHARRRRPPIAAHGTNDVWELVIAPDRRPRRDGKQRRHGQGLVAGRPASSLANRSSTRVGRPRSRRRPESSGPRTASRSTRAAPTVGSTSGTSRRPRGRRLRRSATTTGSSTRRRPPNGRVMVTLGRDQDVRVWDVGVPPPVVTPHRRSRSRALRRGGDTRRCGRRGG